MKLVFATGNKNKIKEIQRALEGVVEIIGLDSLGFNDEISEDFETLEENAMQKASFISEKFGVNCFADDTGLEIDALNGEPGVYSARYAGPACKAEDNMAKVLTKLSGEANRSAKFRTVIALIMDDEKHSFEGEVKGQILESRTGAEGFGYDPIFMPNGFKESFAEMSIDQKNEISHRGKAVKKLVDFLSKSVLD